MKMDKLVIIFSSSQVCTMVHIDLASMPFLKQQIVLWGAHLLDFTFRQGIHRSTLTNGGRTRVVTICTERAQVDCTALKRIWELVEYLFSEGHIDEEQREQMLEAAFSGIKTLSTTIH